MERSTIFQNDTLLLQVLEKPLTSPNSSAAVYMQSEVIIYNDSEVSMVRKVNMANTENSK